MGIQREPGQKGVSWSNIAVGELASTLFTVSVHFSSFDVSRWYYEHGNASFTRLYLT